MENPSMENPRNDGKCNHDGGCCPLDLPKGAKSIRAVFYLLNKTSPLWKNYPCNYVTVMDRTRFKFNATYLTSSAFYDINNGEVSAVMEWKIEEKRCKDPKIHKHGSYACVSNNSECTNTSDDAGYACKCSKGYYGNPYLINGCKGSSSFQPDVNECMLFHANLIQHTYFS